MSINILVLDYGKEIDNYLSKIGNEYIFRKMEIITLESGIYDIVYVIQGSQNIMEIILANEEKFSDVLTKLFYILDIQEYDIHDIFLDIGYDKIQITANVQNINTYVSTDEDSDYDMLGLLPDEILLETIKFSTLDDIKNLCRTNSHYENLCKNWIKVLRFKYPYIRFDDQGNKVSHNKLSLLENNSFDNRMFILASEKGYLDIIKYLIKNSDKYKIDPTIRDDRLMELPGVDYRNRATIYAIKNGHFDLVKYLLSLPNIKNTVSYKELLYTAKGYKRHDIYNYLINMNK